MPRAFEARLKSLLSSKPKENIDSKNGDEYLEQLVASGSKSFVKAEPREVQTGWEGSRLNAPGWVKLFIEIASMNLSQGKSTIILIPDYREHQQVADALTQLGLGEHVANYSQEQPKSKQYEAFLTALEKNPSIVVGSRSAAYAPAHNLGSILIFDEADRSYADQAAPYLHSRDVVLVRQSIEKCSLVFASHSISCDMKRLLDSKFLVDRTSAFAAPRISNSEPGLRVDSHAYSAIKSGLGARIAKGRFGWIRVVLRDAVGAMPFSLTTDAFVEEVRSHWVELVQRALLPS
jgi:hypothetical protein